MEAQGLKADVKRLFVAHGYFGAGTASPPTGPFCKALTAYKETGDPRHGAGAAFSLSPLPFAEVGFVKWENKLAQI